MILPCSLPYRPKGNCVGRCGVVGSTLAFGSFESEHRLFSHHSASDRLRCRAASDNVPLTIQDCTLQVYRCRGSRLLVYGHGNNFVGQSNTSLEPTVLTSRSMLTRIYIDDLINAEVLITDCRYIGCTPISGETHCFILAVELEGVASCHGNGAWRRTRARRPQQTSHRPPSLVQRRFIVLMDVLPDRTYIQGENKPGEKEQPMLSPSLYTLPHAAAAERRPSSRPPRPINICLTCLGLNFWQSASAPVGWSVYLC